MSISLIAFRPSSIRLILDSDPRMTFAACWAEMPLALPKSAQVRTQEDAKDGRSVCRLRHHQTHLSFPDRRAAVRMAGDRGYGPRTPDWQDSSVITRYTGVRTNVSRIAKTKLSPRSVPLMHIVGAIAFRPLALRCATAMITQMGFHAMPSGTWLEGCVTQLVNPLSAFSLIAVRGISHVRARWTLPGAARPPGNPSARPRRVRAGSRPARRPGPPPPTGAVAGPRPASVPVSMAGPKPISPGHPLQPNAAPHSPRRAVITAPFMCGPAWPQCTCSAHFPYHGFHGVIR